LERLGFFNPLSTAADVENFRVDKERYDYWMSVGAQPSERVSKLVKAHTEDSA
jgi:small subunit ribosomal protein S16